MFSRRRLLANACSLVVFLVGGISGCGLFPFKSALNSVDDAIEQLKKGVKSFDQISKVLTDLNKNLDNGTYKGEVQELINNTGQIASISYQGALDFTATRIIEDLEDIKNKLQGKPSTKRKPSLTLPGAFNIDVASPARTTLTIVGWNLNVVSANPTDYGILIKNDSEPDYPVDPRFINYTGPYAITLATSSNGGIPFKPGDYRLYFKGFPDIYEIPIINNPHPEYYKEILIENHTNKDDKDDSAWPRYTFNVEGQQVISFIAGQNKDTWSNPGITVVKIVPGPYSKVGKVDAIHRWGILLSSHANEIDQEADYVYVTTPDAMKKIPCKSGKRGTFVVTQEHDNTGWNVDLVVKGVTEKGETREIANEGDVWFGTHSGHDYGLVRSFDIVW